MTPQPIRELSLPRQLLSALALLCALSALPVRAQRRPEQSAAAAAAERAKRPAQPTPPIQVAPPVRTAPPPSQPTPISPPAPPRPVVTPAVRPLGARPIQPLSQRRFVSPLVPRPLGTTPIQVGEPSAAPFPVSPILPQRPPTPPRVLARAIPTGPPYCTPLSIVYNTGSICFNPDLFTIDPAFRPWGLYVPPPRIGASGYPDFSPYSPALLLQYCPTCTLKNAGYKPASGLPIARSSPPSPASPISAKPSGPAVILVLENGTAALVSRYWLGSDWLLHFVTVTGLQEAIPLNQLNLKATGAANFQRGVVFSLPGWPNPQ